MCETIRCRCGSTFIYENEGAGYYGCMDCGLISFDDGDTWEDYHKEAGEKCTKCKCPDQDRQVEYICHNCRN